MNSALIVSASEGAAGRIDEWLGIAWTTAFAASASEARVLLDAQSYELLVINAPLPDGREEILASRAGTDVLLLVPQESYGAVRARMEPRGVLTLGKPLSPPLFQQAVGLLRALRAKVSRLEGKLEEVRIVERAKWALTQTLHMSEAQAHRYIEKQAMDLRQTRRKVAEHIVKTYEN